MAPCWRVNPGRRSAIPLRAGCPAGPPAGVVADLARRHEEPQRAALRIRHGVQLGVQPALRSPDEATALVVGPPFLARRLEAVRCAFR